MSDSFEKQLKTALERKQAPDGFTERVLDKLPPRRPRMQPYWLSLVAAIAILAVLVTGFEQRRAQRKNARQTERQVVFALALAMEKVQHVNERLQQSAPKMKVQERQGSL